MEMEKERGKKSIALNSKQKGILESYLLIYDLKIKEIFPFLYWKRRHIFQNNTEERSVFKKSEYCLKIQANRSKWREFQ